jgi:hypothetical protein
VGVCLGVVVVFEDRGVKVVLGWMGRRDIFCGVSEGWNESTFTWEV